MPAAVLAILVLSALLPSSRALKLVLHVGTLAPPVPILRARGTTLPPLSPKADACALIQAPCAKTVAARLTTPAPYARVLRAEPLSAHAQMPAPR